MSKGAFWACKENQRQFLQSVAERLSIKKPDDWGRVSKREFVKHGGGTLLNYYNGSLRTALEKVFTETNWKREWFKLGPSYWNNTKNQRNFLELIARKYNIRSASDWKKVKRAVIIEMGGATLLDRYGNSLKNALGTVFPEEDWESVWTKKERGYWSNKQNQLSFLNEIAKKFKIVNPHEWGSISSEYLIESGGASLVKKYGSLLGVLKAVYTDIEWNESWFVKTPGYWSNNKNQSAFLSNLRSQLNLTSPESWGLVTKANVINHGGAGLLAWYDGSLRRALETNYSGMDSEICLFASETNWRIEWFRVPKYSNSFWDSDFNRRSFLFSIANKYGLSSNFDWIRVTKALIQRNGGQGLLKKYGDSLMLALESTFGNFKALKTEVAATTERNLIHILRETK